MKKVNLIMLVAVVCVVPSCAGQREQDGAGQDTSASSPDPGENAPGTPTASPSPTSGGGRSPTASPSPAGVDLEWASCRHPEGIVVSHPEGWHVNSGEALPPCSAFDPEPLNVPDAQEYFKAAVLLSVEEVDFSLATDPESQAGAVLDRRQIIVDGQDAVRLETRAEGEGRLEQGTRSTRWFVVLGREKTLSMSTHEVGDARDYESNQKVLDEMVTRLELPPPS